MTEDEREALQYLARQASRAGGLYIVLQKMLARPVMPEEPSEEMATALRVGWYSFPGGSKGADWKAAYRALYAHLTAPKTTIIEVWRVEYCAGRAPMCEAAQSRSEAEARAERRRREADEMDWRCIRVTGPHWQEVPA